MDLPANIKTAEKTLAEQNIGRESDRVLANLASIKRIIAIHSGKGGVGKTFFAVNLAYGLERLKKNVAILDADLDCPNVPKLLGIQASITLDAQNRMAPVPVAGITILSSAFLQREEANPLIIRGPIKHQLLRDFLANTDWGPLDYLIIDLPPGTSDIPLSLYQLIPRVEVIIISTPQKEAVLDSMRSAILAKQTGAAIIGFVENMSASVFGSAKVDEIARGLELPMLSHIPLLQSIAELSDAKEPALVRDEVLWTEIMEPLLRKIGQSKATSYARAALRASGSMPKKTTLRRAAHD